MLAFQDYKSCKIIVYSDEGDAVLAETTIWDFDRTTHMATLECSAFHAPIPERVSVLIFKDTGLYEYKGTVRKANMPGGFVGMALYRGKRREDRNATRYTINTPGVVEHFVIINRRVPLHTPLEVLVVNVSTVGCLLRGNINYFNINTVFELKLEVEHTFVSLRPKVVRIQNIDPCTAEYGCVFS